MGLLWVLRHVGTTPSPASAPVALTYRLHPLLKLLLELLLLLPQALQRLLQLISLLADEQHSVPELLRLLVVGLS